MRVGMMSAVLTQGMSPVYRLVMLAATPVVRWWGRLRVTGLDALPASGATLMVANHDSNWDPVVIGVAAAPRRQIRALAKASLWRIRSVGWVLDGMGQIPIDRGRGDAQALGAAIGRLRAGACVGVFPEGTISRGQPLRALSGAGRLALAVPGVQVVCVRVVGAVDIVRFPRRPHLRVEFFTPSGGQPREGETAIGLSRRVMAEIREAAPYAVPGRRRTAERYRRRAEAEARTRPGSSSTR